MKYRETEEMHSQEEIPKMGSLNPEIQRIASELLTNLIVSDDCLSSDEKEEKAIKNALIIRKSFGILFS
ncbi:TPA: hypothetical protein SI311_004946 [Escherichia coli]|nr:hypothetical protein [Escherichia coli]